HHFKRPCLAGGVFCLRDGHHGSPVPGMTLCAPWNTNWGKVMTMSAFRKTSLLFAGLLLAMPATASTTFDGQWSVQIASSGSACTNGASVSIGISNGQVASNTASV